MSNIQQKLEEITAKLRNEDERWDGILELKMLHGAGLLMPLIELLDDENWIIRWCVTEKLGEMHQHAAIGPLIGRLGDEDVHVRKNVVKSLEKFGFSIIPDAVLALDHASIDVRKQLTDILLKFGAPAAGLLHQELEKNHGWVISNQILYIIWRISHDKAEELFIQLLVNKDIRKNVIVTLGLMRSLKSIPYLLRYYEYPELRRLILYAIKFIGPELVFPLIVQSLERVQGREFVLQLILKIGVAMLPHLVHGLTIKNIPKHILVKLLMDIGPEKVLLSIKSLAAKDPEIRQATAELRQRFGLDDGAFGFLQVFKRRDK